MNEIFELNNIKYTYDTLFTYLRYKNDYHSSSNYCEWDVKEVLINNQPGICIFFQETTCKEDWKNNFKFWGYPKLAYKGHVNNLWYHYGFYSEYQSARDNIIKEVSKLLEKINRDNPQIIICGWSLGAALSIICSEDIYFKYYIKPLLITYEGPQCCCTIKTRNFVRSCIRNDSMLFTNGSDIVPLIPFVPLAFKMKDIIIHVGEKFNIFKIFKSGYYHCNVAEPIKEYFKNL